MARLRGVAVCALVVGIVGCGAQRIEPAAAAPVTSPVAPTPTTQPSGPLPTPLSRAPARDESAPSPSPPSASIWTPPASIARWRAAVENYVPSVTQKKMGLHKDSMKPFAQYAIQMHARIHVLFAGQFLASLDRLPSSEPMNRPDLKVKLEIVLDGKEGRIHRMGVTEPSGVTAFDIMTLESVNRAEPFGPPPREIVSQDGFVYLHWQFHRGPEACGTWNFCPFLLASPANAGAN